MVLVPASGNVDPAHSARGRPRRLLSCLIVFVVALLSAGSVGGYLDSTFKQRAQNAVLFRTRDARTTLQALIDAQAAIRGYLLTGRPAYLQAYYGGINTLQGPGLAILQALDRHIEDGPSSVALVQAEIKLWDDLIAASSGANAVTGPTAAITLLGSHPDKPVMDVLRRNLNGAIDTLVAESERRRIALDFEQNLLLIMNAVAGLGTILGLIWILRRLGKEATQREAAMEQALHSREQAIAGREEVRQIFAMAEALQSAAGMPDAAAILRASATRLLPQTGGALYVFNHSRDRLDLITGWESATDDDTMSGAGTRIPDFLIPSECWALKRSKPHMNGCSADALRCCHAPVAGCSLEVPMIGRGEPVGLLVFHADGPTAHDRLAAARDIAGVLADSMSLALSSIMLREKLRNQAVRDSLTGLYNRRFLEEVLHSLTLQVQRRHASLAAIMIDLDHFKRLNDEHGHAMGDRVLKAVGATLLSTMRASDVACRYGGEELVILLPDCTLDMARVKADLLRERICRLTRDNGPQVSASIGVSALPGIARDAEELLATADAAMYRAKQQGRNRVVSAVAASAHGGGILPEPHAEPPDWRDAISLSSLELAGSPVFMPTGSEASGTQHSAL